MFILAWPSRILVMSTWSRVLCNENALEASVEQAKHNPPNKAVYLQHDSPPSPSVWTGDSAALQVTVILNQMPCVPLKESVGGDTSPTQKLDVEQASPPDANPNVLFDGFVTFSVFPIHILRRRCYPSILTSPDGNDHVVPHRRDEWISSVRTSSRSRSAGEMQQLRRPNKVAEYCDVCALRFPGKRCKQVSKYYERNCIITWFQLRTCRFWLLLLTLA